MISPAWQAKLEFPDMGAAAAAPTILAQVEEVALGIMQSKPLRGCSREQSDTDQLADETYQMLNCCWAHTISNQDAF